MPKIEVRRTLVKSAPELWADLEAGRLSDALGEVTMHPEEHERRLAWEGEGLRGTAVLEPSGWGTQVTLTAEVQEVEEAVARAGLWSRLRTRRPLPSTDSPLAPAHAGLEDRLRTLLDDLGMAHRRPYVGQ
jgi:hypothetical protein